MKTFNSLIVPKILKRDPLGFLTSILLQNIKTEEVPSRDNEKFLKSLRVLQKIE